MFPTTPYPTEDEMALTNADAERILERLLNSAVNLLSNIQMSRRTVHGEADAKPDVHFLARMEDVISCHKYQREILEEAGFKFKRKKKDRKKDAVSANERNGDTVPEVAVPSDAKEKKKKKKKKKRR